MDKKLKGRWGENCAVEFLRKNGYSILSLGYKSRFGEVDIIAQKKNIIAMIEVKTRKNVNITKPMEAVDWRKQEKLKLTALQWIEAKKCTKQIRFDVVEVYIDGDIYSPPKKINHIEDAFQ